MHRRHFLSQVPRCIAAASAAPSLVSAREQRITRLTARFVGMMGFIERSDGSYLVATPGRSSHGHPDHQPFLMARSGTRVAAALAMRPSQGVVSAAFDMRVDRILPDAFVYRCLHNARLDIVAGTTNAVSNRATQPAQMTRIVPGCRVRGDVERWASSVVSVAGGQFKDGAAHPDAGRVWSFGTHRQRLTDAVDYSSTVPTSLRLTQGPEVRTFAPGAGVPEELWVVSAAVGNAAGSPARLEHSKVAFDFLANGSSVIAECEDATGRDVPPSQLPCSHPSSASASGSASMRRFPPYTQLCYILIILGK